MKSVGVGFVLFCLRNASHEIIRCNQRTDYIPILGFVHIIEYLILVNDISYIAMTHLCLQKWRGLGPCSSIVGNKCMN